MRVLVTAASRHGGATSIGNEVAAGLRKAGHGVDVVEPGAVEHLHGFDAVVLGSAVYGGRWLDDARALARRLGPELATRPVWMFSSGPVGAPPPGGLHEVHATDVEQRTGAREHRVFGGRIDDCTLSRGERARVRRHRVAQGDYRDWEEIRCWAAGIADQLHLLTDASPEGPPP